jgi:hypothetical protein
MRKNKNLILDEFYYIESDSLSKKVYNFFGKHSSFYHLRDNKKFCDFVVFFDQPPP